MKRPPRSTRRAEADIQATVDRLEEHRTVICVAHRLSTLAAMDRIIVLAAGRMIEQGTYRSCFPAIGPFARMARQQGLTLLPAGKSSAAESAVSAAKV